MDIFEKCCEIWRQIEDESSQIFQTKIIIENKYVGKDNNCLLATVKSLLLLDGKLNQIHFFKYTNGDLIHQIVLLTPQPILRYVKMELSTTKQFVALVSKDTIGIVDVANISMNKTCKKVMEVFTSDDEILSAQWYPHLNDFLVILTKNSINIFQCRSDMRVVNCFHYYLDNNVRCHSKSFGIKEEFVTFDFGSSDIAIDDNKIFILTDSGDILLLPELRVLMDKKMLLPKKLTFLPPSSDNYQDDFTSLIVLRGSLDILVLVNCHGTVQHALVINEQVCVYETINVLSVSDDLDPVLVADRYAYPPRYLLLHSLGIHSCVLPWAVRLRFAVCETGTINLTKALHDAGNAIIDYIIDTTLQSRHKHKKSEIYGISIVREPIRAPELIVFINNREKRILRVRLRQESTLMSLEKEESGNVTTTVSHKWPINHDSFDLLLKAIMTELGRGRQMPCVAVNIAADEDEGEAKLALVLKISEKITSDLGTRLENAGQILDQRMDQMGSIIALQRDQVCTIVSTVEQLQKRAVALCTGYQGLSSRQTALLTRLSRLADRLSAINNTVPRVDRDSVTTIRDAATKIAGLEALLRSCKVRFEQNEEYIDRCAGKKGGICRGGDGVVTEIVMSDNDRERAQCFLGQESDEISALITDIKALMH